MPKCSIAKCKNTASRTSKKHGISYFRFPSNPVQREKWISVVSRQRCEEFFKPNKSSVVCSEHFSKSDSYVTTKGIVRLLKTAVPREMIEIPNSEEIVSENLLEKVAPSPSFEILRMPAASTSSFVNTNNEKLKSPSTSLSLGSILDTPRKIIIKRELQNVRKRLNISQSKVKNLKKKNTRLQKKNASLKTALSELKKKFHLDSNLCFDLTKQIRVTESFNTAFLRTVNKKKISKYPPEVRKFALTLHFYSPAAYKYIRKIYNTCLPHPNTLYDWYKSIEAKPGFTQETLDRLYQKSANSDKELLCSLVVDEMSIRQQKIWTGKHYEGLVDIGIENSDLNQIASQAYVFILVSVNESWKIPLAYFFISSLTAENKANLIKIALAKCHNIGIKVVSLTFDGCKTNLSAMKLLGCKMVDYHNIKPFFRHPLANYEVVVFLDACHMLKLMRNVFESKKVIYNGNNQQIRWKHIEDLHDVQEKYELHLANKLTKKHIWFKNSIMKVKLATQLLSRSVANSLSFCDTVLKLPEFKDSDATIEFILILNNLFDILNSRNFNSGGFKRPLSNANSRDVFDFLQTAKNFLLSLSIRIQRKRTIKKKFETSVVITHESVHLYNCQANTGVVGLLVCIESIKRLYVDYVERSYLSYILAYKFSQDHVELFFGNIRSQGGFNNNPNSRQFKSAYKKLLLHLELSSKFTGNSVPLENVPILTCGSTVSNINNTSVGYRFDIESECLPEKDKQMDDYQNNCDILSNSLKNSCNSEFINQIVGYIAGFVVRNLLKKVKCEPCKESILASDKLWFHKLIDLKDFGGLCYPSEDVYTVCKKTEVIIRLEQRINGEKQITKSHLCSSVLKELLHHNIFSSLDTHSLQQPALFNHKNNLMKALIENYIDVRLHYIAKKETENIKLKSKRQLYNKLNLFQGT